MIRISGLRLTLDQTKEKLAAKAAKKLKISAEDILELNIFKESLDARKKELHFVYIVDVKVKNERKILEKIRDKDITKTPDYRYELPEGGELKKRPVIVGFGPAGMFCALLLAQAGVRPIVLERGKNVEDRTKIVNEFWKTGVLDPENNVQFGEGGAGTFSDGKLTTRSKDKRCRKVLEELVSAGAPEEILYVSNPHVGTDLLKEVVKKIRQKIIDLGGEVRFESKLTDILIEQSAVTGVLVNGAEEIKTDCLVLALGHSARDTFALLYDKKVVLEPKPFAVGVRIEHKQKDINFAQFGDMAYDERFQAAEYKLSYTTEKGRGVYTFCMCPGGYVVAAASEESMVAVNGMSLHKRDGENANSALLVQVYPEDFPQRHPLRCV